MMRCDRGRDVARRFAHKLCRLARRDVLDHDFELRKSADKRRQHAFQKVKGWRLNAVVVGEQNGGLH